MPWFKILQIVFYWKNYLVNNLCLSSIVLRSLIFSHYLKSSLAIQTDAAVNRNKNFLFLLFRAVKNDLASMLKSTRSSFIDLIQQILWLTPLHISPYSELCRLREKRFGTTLYYKLQVIEATLWKKYFDLDRNKSIFLKRILQFGFI